MFETVQAERVEGLWPRQVGKQQPYLLPSICLKKRWAEKRCPPYPAGTLARQVAKLNDGVNSVKNLFVIFVLFSTAVGFVRGDPNIYGPGGVNLGPNGELPPSDEELQKDKLLEEERQKTRLLQEQVQQLQEQVQQLQQVQQQQGEMQWNRQNQLQIEINSGYPPQQNSGWIWGGPFLGSSPGGITPKRKHHGGGGDHHGGDGHNRRSMRGGKPSSPQKR